MKAFIELNEKTEVAAMYYIELPNREGNVLGIVSRQPEEGFWVARYRFRYYRDDEVGFKSNDLKSQYTATARDDEPDPKKKLTEGLRFVLQAMADKIGSKLVVFAEDTVGFAAQQELLKHGFAQVVPTAKGGKA